MDTYQSQLLTVTSTQVEKIDCCLIALGLVSLDVLINQIESMKPRWLCAWNTGVASVGSFLHSSLHEFATVREYVLLPAVEPRVVVPLSSPENAVAGLRLHWSGRWLAWIGLLVACGFVLYITYRKNLSLLVRRPNSLFLAAKAG